MPDMISSSILNSVDEAERWSDHLDKMSGDIYFSREWLALHCLAAEDEASLFTYCEGELRWIYPFILRPLPEKYGVDGYDIENAYGYGGPLSNSEDLSFLKRARLKFEQWCVKKNVMAEFCAFHPLLQNNRWMQGRMSTFEDRKTVSLSLTHSADVSELYSRDGAYMVRRGQRGGIEVGELSLNENYDQFIEMYRKAMRVLDASEFYYFNDTYFKELRHLIENRGWLTVAQVDGQWVAASLFMYGTNYLHYHLSANNFEIKAPGATNMILDSAARKGVSLGLEALHLGGGRTSEVKDSLFKFKRSMGNHECSFVIGKMVHNEVKYQKVVSQWCADHPELERTQGNRLLKYRLS